MERYADRVGGVYEVKDLVQYPYEHPGKTFVYLEEKAAWGKPRGRGSETRIQRGTGTRRELEKVGS
jgi:hypothetical protein